MKRGPYWTNTLGLRPWDDVAREFTRRTGLPMKAVNAQRTGERAAVKLRKAFAELAGGL